MTSSWARAGMEVQSRRRKSFMLSPIQVFVFKYDKEQSEKEQYGDTKRRWQNQSDGHWHGP
jgi:hypothetical protein